MINLNARSSTYRSIVSVRTAVKVVVTLMRNNVVTTSYQSVLVIRWYI